MNEDQNLDNLTPESPVVPEPVVPDSATPPPVIPVEETPVPPTPEIPTVTAESASAQPVIPVEETPVPPTPEIPTVTPEQASTQPVIPVEETPVPPTPENPTVTPESASAQPVIPVEETPVPPTPEIPTVTPESPVFTTEETPTFVAPEAPQPPTIPTIGGSVPPPVTQGDWPSPAGGQVPSYEGVAPQPKRFPLPIIVGIAAVIIIGVVIFMLTRGGGKVKLAANPEDTLFLAMANTEENMSTYPSIFPESTLDYSKPLETALDLSLDASRNKYLGIPDYLSSMRLKLNLKQDTKKREFLFGAQFESPIFTLDYSEFYINPQEALFSIPNLYSEKDYVRIDFATFPKKWNGSDLSQGSTISEDINIAQSITEFLDLLDETVANVKDMDEAEDIEALMKPANDKLKEASTITHLETTNTTFDFKVVIPPDALSLYLETVAEQMEELTFRQNRRIAAAIPASLYEMLGSSPEDFIDSSMESGGAFDALKNITFREDTILIVKVNRDVNRISHVELEGTSFIPDDYYSNEVIYMAGTLSLATGEYAVDDFNLNLLLSPESEGWKSDAEVIEVTMTHKAPEGDLVGNYMEMLFTLDDGSGDLEGMKFVLDLSWNKNKAATEPMVLRMTVEDIYYEEEYGVIISALVASDADKISLTDGEIVVKEGAQDLVNFGFDFSITSITDPIKPVPSTTADFFDVDWRTQVASFISTVSISAYAMM